jgi:hypothetical protein
MRRLVAVAVAWQVLAAAAGGSPARFFDALLAVVEARTVAAIDRAEIQRFIDVLLLLEEAGRVGITADPAQVDRAWTAAVAGWGDEATFQHWLDAHALDRARARRLVEDDVVRARLVETRFADLMEGQTAEQAEREWLEAARRREGIRVLVPPETSAALPFPPR